MEQAVIAVDGPADCLQRDGLCEVQSALDTLGDSALIVGGFMTRIWVHLRPENNLLKRATVDLDLGINRKALRIADNQRVVGPLLEGKGFSAGMGDSAFRYSKELESGKFYVDLLVASGASRDVPPVLEGSTSTIAVPGLAYAFKRGAVSIELKFVEGSRVEVCRVSVPKLDAAFVLKGALAKKGRMHGRRLNKRDTDIVDAILLASLCIRDKPSIEALIEHRKQGEVKSALAFLESVAEPNSSLADMAQQHFPREDWVVGVAQRLFQEVLGG